MGRRHVSSFVNNALGLPVHSAPSEAASTRTSASLNLRAGPFSRDQFNRAFTSGHWGDRASTYRQSSSTIVSTRETGNDPRNKTGNGGFPAWTRGSVWLHAIALEPLEAEAQEATGTPPPPLRPPEHTGCKGGKGSAPIATSDATAAMSGATSGGRARNQRRPRPPPQRQRNRG
jgi:hypothetical protein